MANTFVKIADYTVPAGGAASIDFTSIPSTYTDLLVKASLRDTGNNDYLLLGFNNSTANFSSRYINGDGSTAVSGSRTDGYFRGVVPSISTASTFSNIEFYIPNYAGSTNKSFSNDNVLENNATAANSGLWAGLWSNTAAINRITLNAVGTFAQYSTAYLYGILKS